MKKILIVEDDPNIGVALSIRMKSFGYETALAADAMVAVQTAVKFEPDLVLLDISIPAGTGFTVAERLQALLSRHVPMIFITASNKPELAEKARQVGAADFFQKPYDPQALQAAIERALAEPGTSSSKPIAASIAVPKLKSQLTAKSEVERSV